MNFRDVSSSYLQLKAILQSKLQSTFPIRLSFQKKSSFFSERAHYHQIVSPSFDSVLHIARYDGLHETSSRRAPTAASSLQFPFHFYTQCWAVKMRTTSNITAHKHTPILSSLIKKSLSPSSHRCPGNLRLIELIIGSLPNTLLGGEAPPPPRSISSSMLMVMIQPNSHRRC